LNIFQDDRIFSCGRTTAISQRLAKNHCISFRTSRNNLQEKSTRKQITKGDNMFNAIKCSIVVGLALTIQIITPAVLAADIQASESNINTDWLKNRFADDSPENIKLRSAPGDPVAGEEKSQLCQGCHGEKGISAEPMIPNLAGQYGKYISKELRNFQNGVRTHQIMSQMAKTIDDNDLADIAAYFSSMPKMSGDGSGDSNSKAQVGKNLFLNGDMNRMIVACTNCHGVAGKGRAPNISMFPVIGGQKAGYLRGQLINWRSAQRTNSPNRIMNRIANKLTDDEIDSLAAYISAQ
jgi:cytochrome c553